MVIAMRTKASTVCDVRRPWLSRPLILSYLPYKVALVLFWSRFLLVDIKEKNLYTEVYWILLSAGHARQWTCSAWVSSVSLDARFEAWIILNPAKHLSAEFVALTPQERLFPRGY